MILVVFEEIDGIEFAAAASGRVFAKPLDSETWRYVIEREFGEDDAGLILTTAPISSLTS